MATEKIPGYHLPLFRSLTEQILVLGAPKGIMVLNATIAAIFIISLHFFYILVLNAVVHFGAIRLSKNDDRFFDCMRVYVRQKNYYDTL